MEKSFKNGEDIEENKTQTGCPPIPYLAAAILRIVTDNIYASLSQLSDEI
jgi:hypothetical protein